VEFTPGAGGVVVRTGRETTQPKHSDLAYWASGLSATYLEGALERALHPVDAGPDGGTTAVRRPVYDGPAPAAAQSRPVSDRASVLDPFAVYAQGEERLRSQLAALDEAHLRNVIRAHGLATEQQLDIDAMNAAGLAELVVGAVRARTR
jgi:hypothetical protein